jgi:hypothetical protein
MYAQRTAHTAPGGEIKRRNRNMAMREHYALTEVRDELAIVTKMREEVERMRREIPGCEDLALSIDIYMQILHRVMLLHKAIVIAEGYTDGETAKFPDPPKPTVRVIQG